MLSRAVAEAGFRDAIAMCDPQRLVAEAIASSEELIESPIVAIAIGKAALAMARGAGEVMRGIAVTDHDDRQPLPPGWQRVTAAHPRVDARSLAAARVVMSLVATAREDERLLALISGGASALVEWPRIALEQLQSVLAPVMAAGVPIEDLNAVRGALSTIKSGRLALRSHAPIVTLATSDVIGDALAVIGSGPTVGPWLDGDDDVGAFHEAQRLRARAVLARCGIEPLAILAEPVPSARVTRHDHAIVIAPIASFGRAAATALAARGVLLALDPHPLRGEVTEVAAGLAGFTGVAWGEPTVTLPAQAGEGGRAQQLALALARHLRGGPRAALVVGSDGSDGPAPAGRPQPAGAFVDGTTWDAIAASGRDPAAALARADAGPALASVGALIITGATGINHADLVVIA